MTFRLPSLEENNKLINEVISVYKKDTDIGNTIKENEIRVSSSTKQKDEDTLITSVNLRDKFDYSDINDNILYVIKMLSKEVYYCDDIKTLQRLLEYVKYLENMVLLKVDLVSIKNSLGVD